MRVLRFVSLLALVSSALSASAVLIDFEGASNTPGIASIANGYAGFNWSNFYVQNKNSVPGTGYSNGTTSGSYVGFNGVGEPASLSVVPGGDLIRSLSGNFTAAPGSSTPLVIEGYLGGILVQTNAFALTTAGPLSVSLVFATAVDTLRFSTTPFVATAAMDDLRINEISSAVPGPAAALAFGAGLIRRRKRA